MFPNPQAALPLPRRPDAERYKKLARELVNACKSGDEDSSGDWVQKWVRSLAKSSGVIVPRQRPVAFRAWVDQVTEFAKSTLTSNGARRCLLADAQYVLAQSHGFENWKVFLKHLSALKRKSSTVSRFETAADAIITGDVAKLKRLLREEPELIRARSTREHNATLLHYVSANGVEGYRQKTPKNAVKVAEVLLKAGAEVDAEADVYGGGATTLGLVATSVHPFRAGVQNPLIQTLLDHGAEIDHQTSAGNRQNVVRGCLANGRGEAARYLAEHGAQLDLEGAAGVGRLDVVKRYFNEDGSLKRKTTKRQVQSAFHHACQWGRLNVN